MGNKGGCPLPSHTSDLQLASDFSNFFTSKVSTIRESLNHVDTSNFVSPLDDDAPATLHSFSPTTIEEIVRIIKLSPNKSCELDPLPTWLLKLCAQELAPIITAIVNRSFETSCMPPELKRAQSCSTSSEEIISWFRCTEQLSTCVELAFRLKDNRKSCRCSPRRASARKRPTRAITIGLQETPLNRDGAHQDTTRHTPSTWQRTGCCARSPWPVGGVRYNRPFDPHWTSTEIVWHFGRCSNLGSILLATEKPASPDRWHCLGWSRNWVRSTTGIRAWPEAIHTVYKATRRRHQASPTRYALLRDDTQLYVSFENNAPEQQSTAVTRLNTCIGDIRNWLANNMLKLNDDKTEVILLTSKHALKSHPNVAVTVGEEPVRPATSIHNLGVVYDQPLSMIQHVNSVCRVGYMHVRNIGRIRRYLTEDATKTIVGLHALVTSRLDYCNAVLYGLPASVTNKMQRLQNTCARIITQTRRREWPRDHITPMLIKLHWLPVRRRIDPIAYISSDPQTSPAIPLWHATVVPTSSCTAVAVDLDTHCTSFKNENVRWPLLPESSSLVMEQFACQSQGHKQYCRISARLEDTFI